MSLYHISFLITVTDTPTDVKGVRTGEYTVQVSWAAPASNTPSVAGYEVFYAESGSDVIQSAGTTTSTTIRVTVPTLGAVYDFFVVAFSDAENALPSSPSNVIGLSTCKCDYILNICKKFLRENM